MVTSTEIELPSSTSPARAAAGGGLRQAINAQVPGFRKALPSHIDVERFTRNALSALNANPKLAECTEESVIIALMEAAQFGLEISSVRGQAYLIPRYDKDIRGMKAQFQLGYRGVIDLAARGGITIDCDEIREYDKYDIERGTNPRLFHKPVLGQRGAVLGYYAVADFGDGRRARFEVMSVSEAEEHRDKFASQKTKDGRVWGPWVDHFDAMSIKTVILKLLNYLPQSIELRKAAAIDSTAFDVTQIEAAPGVSTPAVIQAEVRTTAPEPPRSISAQASNQEVIEATTEPATAPPEPTLPPRQQTRQPPRNTTPPDAGSEYGDIVTATPASEPVEPEREQRSQGQTPLVMISNLAGQHGIETKDDIIRMCSQIIGREIASAKDLKPADQTKIVHALQALAEDAPFEFVGVGVPASVPLPDAKAAATPVESAPPPPQPPGDDTAEEWGDQEWRTHVTGLGIRITDFIKVVRQTALDAGAKVTLLEEIAGKGISGDLLAWCETNRTLRA